MSFLTVTTVRVQCDGCRAQSKDECHVGFSEFALQLAQANEGWRAVREGTKTKHLCKKCWEKRR